MTARWWAFGLWALVAASTLYWGLRLFTPAKPIPPQTAVAAVSSTPRGDLTRLFGVDAPPPAEEAAAPPPMAARFQLVGVVAPKTGGGFGVALIAVDGKPARAYRVGAAVDGDTVLQSVRQRGAALGLRDGTTQVSLEIPPLAPAATGTLPPAAGAPAVLPPPAAPALRPPVNLAPLPTVRPQPVVPPSGVAPSAIAPPPIGRPDGVQAQ